MSSQAVSESPPSAPQDQRGIRAEDRLEQLKRGYQKQLGRKPTSIQSQLMQRAALLTTRAEIAAYDPKCDANTIVRLDHCAARARQEMLNSFVPVKPKPETPTLSEVLRS